MLSNRYLFIQPLEVTLAAVILALAMHVLSNLHNAPVALKRNLVVLGVRF